MKAMVCREYGSPDILNLEEIETPIPKANEILIKNHASSVNALDWHFLRGKPIMLRLQYGFFKPRRKILGYDFAGIVNKIGNNVKKFKVGDEVFGGTPDFYLGAFAEYISIPENGFVTTKPSNISFEQAAAVPGAAVAALIGLKERGNLQSGQHVIINGSSGGVGTFAVQIAKTLGAEVTAVCSTGKIEMVRRLGADHIIDYKKEDFTKSGKTYDLLLDNVGNHKVREMMSVIRPGGTCTVVGFTNLRLMMQQAIFGSREAKKNGINWSKPSSDHPEQKHAESLKHLLETGKIVPEIEKTYSLEQLPQAIEHIEAGHAQSKIVILI